MRSHWHCGSSGRIGAQAGTYCCIICTSVNQKICDSSNPTIQTNPGSAPCCLFDCSVAGMMPCISSLDNQRGHERDADSVC